MADLYFKSEEIKLIFTLVETKGATQLNLLGLDYSYYCDREKAKNWYEDIKNKLENTQHPMLNEAMQSLNKLYKGMGGKQ